MDLKNTGVETINTAKLLDHFNNFHLTHEVVYHEQKQQLMKRYRSINSSKISEIDVYQLVHFFIEISVSRFAEKAVFIIDECPILSRHDSQGK